MSFVFFLMVGVVMLRSTEDLLKIVSRMEIKWVWPPISLGFSLVNLHVQGDDQALMTLTGFNFAALFQFTILSTFLLLFLMSYIEPISRSKEGNCSCPVDRKTCWHELFFGLHISVIVVAVVFAVEFKVVLRWRIRYGEAILSRICAKQRKLYLSIIAFKTFFTFQTNWRKGMADYWWEPFSSQVHCIFPSSWL